MHNTLREIVQSLTDDKLRELFPLRRKQHTMDTRRKEKFETFLAYTERYRNSPILFGFWIFIFICLSFLI